MNETSLLEQMGTVTGIVVLAMGIVQVLKLLLAKYKLGIVSDLPTPLLCVGVSMGLTLLASLVLKTLPGEWYNLLWQAVLASGTASGFFTWLKEPLDSPSKTVSRMVPLLLPLLLIGGCTGVQWDNTQTWTPEGQLAVAYETFEGTTKALTIVVQTGKLSKAEATEILGIVKLGQQCLDQWRAALDLKLPTATIIEQWNVIIQEMLAKRIAAERKALAAEISKTPINITIPMKLLDIAA